MQESEKELLEHLIEVAARHQICILLIPSFCVLFCTCRCPRLSKAYHKTGDWLYFPFFLVSLQTIPTALSLFEHRRTKSIPNSVRLQAITNNCVFFFHNWKVATTGWLRSLLKAPTRWALCTELGCTSSWFLRSNFRYLLLVVLRHRSGIQFNVTAEQEKQTKKLHTLGP